MSSSTTQTVKVLVHIVTFNSEKYVSHCIDSAGKQSGFTLGTDLLIHITDNNSSDSTVNEVESRRQPAVSFHRNLSNLGFGAAHNQGLFKAHTEGFTHILILNPDVSLTGDALAHLMRACHEGFSTPKLLRANESLKPLSPPVLDAAGMVLENSLRHFDRGSGELDLGQYQTEEFVFGGTGACLLVSISAALKIALPYSEMDEDLFKIYPQLEKDFSKRIQLFDEAFFAYREDADLAWRAQLLGYRYRYEPQAIGYHVRRVTPEKRGELPALINMLGVRNRFLLQLNNWGFSHGFASFFHGILLRNIVVTVGVLLIERSSLGAFKDLTILLKRALYIRGVIRSRM